MKNLDNITFVRWGNLNPRKHKEGRLGSEDQERNFHTAPCYQGIYVFPQGFVEPFLLGGVKPVNGKIQDRCFFLRDENGDKIDANDFWDEDDYTKVKDKYREIVKKKKLKIKDIFSEYYEGEDKNYVCYTTNRHKDIKYTGELWHHLEVDKKDVISQIGSWYKTTYKVYVQALKKCIYKDKFGSYIQDKDRHGDPHSYPYRFTKDHFEVFIEKLK